MTYSPPTKRGSMTEARIARIFLAAGGKCGICGNPIRHSDKFDIEHRDPLWAGGSDDDANLYPVHVRCHAPKTAMETGQRAKRNETIARGYVNADSSRKPFPGSKRDRWKKRMDGSVILRGGND